MRRNTIQRVLLATLLACPSAWAQTGTQVELFSPQGTVKDVRQVTARFSSTMTALGDPALEDPFAVDCPVAGSGRWADGRNWVYDFDEDLPGGVVCTFTLEDGLTDHDGRPVAGQRDFRFDTGGPAIRASLPREGSSVDENQIFILALDAEASADSVRAHAYCAVEGLAERIPVRVLEGEPREAVLAQRRELGYAYYSILWKNGAETFHRVRDRSLEAAERAVMVVACARPLPPGARLRLVWGTGIAAASGLSTGSDQALAFRTRPPFTARLQCRRANAQAPCLPIEPVTLVFSAPVPREAALQARIHGPDGSTAPLMEEAGASPVVESLRFPASYLARAEFELHLPADLRDDAERPLENAASFPLAFATDEFPPLAKFSGSLGILEAGEGGVLPVTVRNLRVGTAPNALVGRKLRVDQAAEVAGWLRRQEGLPVRESIFAGADAAETFDLPLSGDGSATEVVGIPLGGPGFYVVELASPKLGEALLEESAVYHVRTAALVTNLAVHLKWGRERSLLWVTRLDDGEPVPGADVELTNLCTGARLWAGRSGADGTAWIDGAVIGPPRGHGSCRNSGQPVYMASARAEGDFTFTLTNWTDGIEPYAFGLPTGSRYAADVVHTVFDRTLLRAGETVSMKHFFRRRTMSGLEQHPAGTTLAVEILHHGSGERYASEIDVGNDAVAEQRWEIPAEAKLGDYSVRVRLADGIWRQGGQFRVEEFRVPTMKAVVQGPPGPQVRPEGVTLDLHLRYQSGGSAAGAAVKLRTATEPLSVSFADYRDFQFGGQPVSPGRESAAGGYFDPEAMTGAPPLAAELMPLTLDADGAARVELPVPDVDAPRRLTAELEYADPNGEILTTAGRVDLWPAAVVVGIRREGWVASQQQLRFRVLVLDPDGSPVAGRRAVARLYSRNTYSYRKRLIGGFYAYESVTETEALDTRCEGDTDPQGLLLCEVAPGVAGEVVVRAEAQDSAGNAAGATASIWVVGDDDWWFGSTAGDRMDVLPEQNDYQPGDVARFQVRMPFREATALVTVEREGVLHRFVTVLRGQAPVVELPIQPEYAPNVFVSVLAVRGRVGGFRSWLADQARDFGVAEALLGDGGRPTALVDLSKPSFRLGTAGIRVGWAPYRLDVAVEPERAVYRVRDPVKLRVKASRADGTPPPPGAEVAVAVVDEGLLNLAPNESWQLLDAMMGHRGLEVWTATAQMQVVGKRHYGRKAVPQGGGGGREQARELFDTLVAWHGRVVLNDAGEAELEVPLNDSLTRFRIVAVAHAGAELFGTGSATVTTTQDLMLLSGLPPLVREGDVFAATFTVRNASDRDVEAEVAATTTAAAAGEALAPQRIALEAGEARDVVWQVRAPTGASAIDWSVSAAEVGGTAKDRLAVAQRLIPAHPERVYQATIARLDSPMTLPLERPEQALPGRGGINVALRSKLGDGLDGVRRYMTAYDYTCLEQNLSRAVALRDPDLWEAWTARLPAYLDEDGLLKYFPSEALPGEDILTSYVLAIAHESGWTIPEAVRGRLVDGLRGFVEGRILRRSALPTADLAIRKLAALEALSRYGAAHPAMLSSIDIEPDLWPTSAVIDWLNLLERLPGIPDAPHRAAQAEGIIRARLNFQGTTLGFSTERTDALWWLMVSTDVNAVRALASLLDRPAWRDDVPRLVRGALGRQQNGHWNTTVANAWGVLAMERFSAAFENEPVTGTTTLRYAGAESELTWAGAGRELGAEFDWRDGPASLAVRHAGSGKPWVTVQALAAMPLREPLSSGYRIDRTLTAVEQKNPGRWTRGDLVRVRLELEAQSDMTWVVVDDPVPAGSTILGSGLGGQSRLAVSGERREGWVWPAFEERRFDAFRAYYRWVPKGRWTVEYTVRLNNPGEFQLPATRVEALYAPEMFGARPNPPITVEAVP